MSERNNSPLPRFLTKFVGRATEIEQLETLFNTAQLVTVIGFIGVGKTRLAVEVARRMGERLQDGACFVSLEGLLDLSACLQATGDALSLPADSKLDAQAQLRFALSHSEMLLVLDSAEGLVSKEFANFLSEILRSSPSLRLLVTSQQPLGLQGEQIFPLAPMALPSYKTKSLVNEVIASGLLCFVVPPRNSSQRNKAKPSVSEANTEVLEDIKGVDSVRLFVTRAQARLPAWKVTPENASTIAEVCRTLDGIPLALELAAGQLKPGAETALLAGLKNGLENLQATEWDRPARHRSLWTALDNAYAQWEGEAPAEPPERQVLSRLSVLDSGSCFDTAIEPLTGVKDGRTIADALYRAGLLQVEISPDAQLAAPNSVRYRMLNTVRLYGRSHIAHARDELEERIAWYYLQEAQRQGMRDCPERMAAVAWFRVEAANLRQGAKWALRQKDLELLCGYADRLRDVEWEREGRQMIQQLWKTAIEIVEKDPSLLPKLGRYWLPLRDAGFGALAKRSVQAAFAQAQATGNAEQIIYYSLARNELEIMDGCPE